MKKLVSIVLALALIMVVAVASAATIEVKNVIDGEHYTAYKILNYTANGDAVSYYLSASEHASIGSVLEAAGFAFTASADGTQYVLNNADTVDVASVASYLGAHTSDLGSALGTATADGASGEANFTGLSAGYYFVSSSAGSLCALHSETDIATAVEKNTIPEEDKKQSKTDGNYADAQLDVNVGDTVYYQVEITDGKGTNGVITLTDVMDTGLTYQNDAKVYFNNVEVEAGETTFSKTDNDTGFVIAFTAAYVAGLNENDVVVVKYTAKVNESAVIRDEINNTATITYSEQSQTDITKVKTYDVELLKKDGEGEDANALTGAKFNLYTSETGGTALTFKNDATGYYLSDAEGASVEIDAGDGTGVNIRGLEPGTYWFEETVAPDGYNKLAGRVSVTVVTNATAAAKITVVNNAGTQLPSTGGIGTTIFYVLGGILVIGAAVILIARRKAHD